MRTIVHIAPDVGWLPVSFANVYFIGHPGGKWVLVDTGLPGRANDIIEPPSALRRRFAAGGDFFDAWPRRPCRLRADAGRTMGRGHLCASSRTAVSHRQIGLSPGGPDGRRCDCVSLAFFPVVFARLGQADPRVAFGQGSRPNRLAMGGNSRAFARSCLVISAVGPGAACRRCICDNEHGFLERVVHRAGNNYRGRRHHSQPIGRRLARRSSNWRACGRTWSDAAMVFRFPMPIYRAGWRRFAARFRRPGMAVMCDNRRGPMKMELSIFHRRRSTRCRWRPLRRCADGRCGWRGISQDEERRRKSANRRDLKSLPLEVESSWHRSISAAAL